MGHDKGLLAGQGNKYICITRPRRFGKTSAANMIAAYFGRGNDGLQAFGGLKIQSDDRFLAHLNQHNVVYISLNEMPRECFSYAQYISRIHKRLLSDFMQALRQEMRSGMR